MSFMDLRTSCAQSSFAFTYPEGATLIYGIQVFYLKY